MKEHPVFPKLENENVKIWRYVDFTKFVSLLDTKSLFFSRSDKLGDLFEGSTSRANIKLRPSIYQDKIPELGLKQMSEFTERLRYHTFLNCWHINEFESDAMWKLYAKNNTGIAIQSTYKRLVDVLKENEEAYVGEVKYIDYESDWLPEGFTFYQFMHKQNSFKHETELRAIIQRYPNPEKGIFIDKPGPLGLSIQINLDELIEKIYISSTSPEWFSDLVKSISKKYNMTKEISFSKLSERPVY